MLEPVLRIANRFDAEVVLTAWLPKSTTVPGGRSVPKGSCTVMSGATVLKALTAL